MTEHFPLMRPLLSRFEICERIAPLNWTFSMNLNDLFTNEILDDLWCILWSLNAKKNMQNIFKNVIICVLQTKEIQMDIR